MEKKFFSLNEINDLKQKKKEIKKLNKDDIAVIGISGKFASTRNLNEFWDLLEMGKSAIGAFPKNRLEKVKHMNLEEDKIIPAGYMEEVDQFDHEFFGLSLKESKTIDPNQRILLEMIWKALEEAGYADELIKGSKTGVFIGFSCDHKLDYMNYLKEATTVPEEEISLAGNVRSVLGSRISYLLDLKGPSVVVDTACSSGLSALHLACNSLKNGESQMAIVGGINSNILPVQRGLDDVVGIRSPQNRVRAFDEGANGIASGEGTGVVVLKSLEQAIKDKDHIHAVIKATAMNQDGSSIGLTAPNAVAQTDVLVKAWQDAKIDPTTISYIEAHGTGTKLGDPIEIDGITNAFKKFTDRKNFCAIGSLKTNIGHLDGAAGIASLIKTILMLKHKELVPSLYFLRPNSKIDFMSSPVYVNDKCKAWTSEGPLRCGINAFGLSGTNCHVVLEEYVPSEEKVVEDNEGMYLCTLSAKDKVGVINLAKDYVSAIASGTLTKEALKDVCSTSNLGRRHLECRLAVVANSYENLKRSLEAFINGEETDQYEYSRHRKVNYKQEKLGEDEVDDAKLHILNESIEKAISALSNPENSKEESYKQIAKLYVAGGTPAWQKLYGEKRKKVSLPTYHFKNTSCWPKLKTRHSAVKESKQYPLLNGEAIVSMEHITYNCYLSDENWVIGEHLINERCVLPGTAYIETLVQIAKQTGLWQQGARLTKLIFINQFAVSQGEEKVLQVIIENKGQDYPFKIVSRSQDGVWTTHAEGKFETLSTLPEIQTESLETLLNAPKDKLTTVQNNKVVTIGEHWETIKKEVYKFNDKQYLVYFELADEFSEEVNQYGYHPAAMDRGINAAIDFLKEDTYFLPFKYESLTLMKSLPKAFYSLVNIKAFKGEEIVVSDVILYDLEGHVVAYAEDYAVKQVSEKDTIKPLELRWQEVIETSEIQVPHKVAVVGEEEDVEKFKATCLDKGVQEILPIYLDKGSEKVEHMYEPYVEQIVAKGMEQIVYLGAHCEDKNDTVIDLFLLMKALMKQRLTRKVKCLVVTENAYKVTKEDKVFNPYHTSLGALAQVARQEHTHLLVEVLDTSSSSKHEAAFEEMCKTWDRTKVAYRDGKVYEEKMMPVEGVTEPVEYANYKEEGIYLITGGTGELGLAVAKYLTSKGKINIALMSRSATKHEEAIRDIRTLGAQIELVDGDVGSHEALSQVIVDLREKYGRINGIFHCAGIVSKGLILTESIEDFHTVTRSKMEATIYLDELTKQDKPDFMVYFSSINALTGGVGQGDYASANAFLDGFSAYRNSQGYKTLAINWPGWKDIGMAKRHHAFGKEDLLEGIMSQDAVVLMGQAMTMDNHQLILGRMKAHKGADKVKADDKVDSNLTETENKVAKVWKKVLEVDEISIVDNFSDLGGDSIMANYLYKQLEKEFQGIIDITDVFSYPTIKSMSEFIDKKMGRIEESVIEPAKEEVASDIDDLLSKLARGEISVEEMEKLF